jgi:hypothetical protein
LSPRGYTRQGEDVRSTIDIIVAGAAEDDVVPAQSIDAVLSVEADDAVRLVGADQVIVGTSSASVR